MSRRWITDDAWARRARLVDARAATRTDVLRDSAAGKTRFPRYAARGSGAYVWDLEGRRYTDYLLGYGPIILGHAEPAVTAAVAAELQNGTCFSPLWSRQQVELTETLVDIIPGAERALLLKTGSDATSAAVRLARVFTSREKIVRWGYNGWHDWSVWQSAGVPHAVRASSMEFDGTVAGLRECLSGNEGEVAAVVMMPFEFEMTSTATLQELVDTARAHGALVIFDEMRSGFRMSLGGAQEYFSVTADLATFSKAMANGFAISAVTGRADVMECLRRTKISSTFFASSLEMVAALVTLDRLRSTDALDRIWKSGTRLQTGMRTLIAEYNVPADVRGYAPFPFMSFDRDNPVHDELVSAFYAETAAGGVLLHPEHQWFVSAAHSERDIDSTLETIAAALGSLAARGLL